MNDNSKVQSLSQKTIKSITIFIDKGLAINQKYWIKLVYATISELRRRRITANIIVMNDEHHDKIFEDENRLLSDGFIFVGSILELTYKSLRQMGIPYVLLDCTFIDNESFQIKADNFNSGYKAAQILASNGHKNLAFFGDVSVADSYLQRYLGFKQYILEHLNEVIDIFSENYKDYPDIYSQINRLTEEIQSGTKLDGVFCASDNDAVSMYKLIARMGLTVAKDISVLSFDNLDICEYLDPPLSSIHFSKIEMVIAAIDTLIKKINNPHLAPKEILISTKIINRKSIGSI